MVVPTSPHVSWSENQDEITTHKYTDKKKIHNKIRYILRLEVSLTTWLCSVEQQQQQHAE